ncbi:serine hydrolase domain-containing protein, partial [Sinomicrobium weinanense]
MKRRKKVKYPILLAVLVLALTSQFCIAQIPQSVKDEIKTRTDNGVYPSTALGVWEEGKETYFIYGYRNIERQEKADRNTLYEIGSITKTYTGLLLARYTAEEKLALDYPADTLLPDSIRLRDGMGNAIRLGQLATHTSGLPRLPDNLLPSSLDNPYQDYTRKDLFYFLKHYKPKNIGQRYLYSNLGAGLLGELLAISQEADYAQLLQKEILAPLQLKHTYIEVPKQQSTKLATGYMGRQSVSHWDFDALAGAGALKTNITELLAYGKSYLDPENPLKKAAEISIKPHYTDKNKRKYGLGWHFLEGLAWHNGGTGGFRSFIGINPEKNRVVAIMVNSGSNPADDIGLYLSDPDKHKLPVTPEIVDIAPEELQNYAGSYQNNSLGLHLRLTAKNNALYASLPGQQEQRIYYCGDHNFFYKTALARLMFEADENDTIVGLTLYQNGQEVLL